MMDTATASIFAVRGDEFPEWTGDILIGSLRTMGLFRVRLSGERVVYVEPIPAGERIRDLTQTPDGKILLWVDRGAVLQVTRSSSGAYVRYCAGCHEPTFGPPPGPDLHGAAGRHIAAIKGFAYSDALAGKSDRWTPDNLRSFLADPESFARGTTMRTPEMEETVREEIVEFLLTYTRTPS